MKKLKYTIDIRLGTWFEFFASSNKRKERRRLKAMLKR